jgi:hypothetical protein
MLLIYPVQRQDCGCTAGVSIELLGTERSDLTRAGTVQLVCLRAEAREPNSAASTRGPARQVGLSLCTYGTARRGQHSSVRRSPRRQHGANCRKYFSAEPLRDVKEEMIYRKKAS